MTCIYHTHVPSWRGCRRSALMDIIPISNRLSGVRDNIQNQLTRRNTGGVLRLRYLSGREGGKRRGSGERVVGTDVRVV
jgi:hypothetical protein